MKVGAPYNKYKESIMFTINLKEKLLSEKARQLQQDKKSLGENALNQANKLLEESANKDLVLLRTVGFGRAIDASKQVISEKKRQIKLSSDQSLFSLEEIRKICIKYRLRFLPIEDYQGILDFELPQVLRKYISRDTSYSKFYICAPVSSFAKVVTEQKDPLLFVQEADSFRLLHKWGNDLSIFRRILGFFTSSVLKIFSMISIITCLPLYLVASKTLGTFSACFTGLVVGLLAACIFSLIFLESKKFSPTADCWNERRREE